VTEILKRINAQKREKKAVVLAHYYQTADIQEAADHVGDSFELAKIARDSDAEVIVLCGVRFMAESAKILNPDKTVLLPAPDAGCPMADMVTPEDVRKLRAKYPDAAVVCYINSSAAVKAECDICCTSSSAVRIVRSLPEHQIIFVPDRNLGAYVASQVPEKEFVLFDGYCPVHNAVTAGDVKKAQAAHPGAPVLMHPECPPEALALADYIGSTKGIIDYFQSSPEKEFIIGTERGVSERLAAALPDKKAHLLSECLLCRDMKKTTIEDLLASLEYGRYAITLPEQEMKAAYGSLNRMVMVK
jgi:quinolinate synthase